ncbi:MAG: sugar ABC transporter permease [Clostridia bacterium]|nr:sugar ABC transporter permease [Clostridia bacterium]
MVDGKAHAVKRKGRTLKRLEESWQWYILLLPGLVYLIIFNYLPMGGVLIAFKNFRPSTGIFDSVWTGFQNFQRFFEFPDMLKLIGNTLSITLLNLAMFPIPIIFALMLNEVRNAKIKKSVQMVTYIPHFLSEVVVCSLVILFLEKDNGVITDVLTFFGMPRQNLLGSPEAFPWIYSLMCEWQGFGWSAILYISALSGVPQENVEAAKIDGANRLQVIRHINIPSIMPTIVITFILKLGGLMNLGYTKIYLLQNSLNLPASRVLSTYVYEIGLISQQYSYSTAIGLFNTIVNVMIVLSANYVIKKVSDVGLF